MCNTPHERNRGERERREEGLEKSLKEEGRDAGEGRWTGRRAEQGKVFMGQEGHENGKRSAQKQEPLPKGIYGMYS